MIRLLNNNEMESDVKNISIENSAIQIVSFQCHKNLLLDPLKQLTL
jgi:hypothetical protein